MASGRSSAIAPAVLLPPHLTFWSLINCSHFWVSAVILIALVFGITYGITYNSVKDSPYLWIIFDVNEVVNICLTTFFLTLAIFMVNHRMARKRIILGAQAPLAFSAYESNCFKKYFLFALGVRDWRKRIGLMLIQCFIFPTAFIIAGLAAGCAIEKSRHEEYIEYEYDSKGATLPPYMVGQGDYANMYAEKCYMQNIHGYCVLASAFRAVLIFFIFLFNYIGSYNDHQPELIELNSSAAALQSEAGGYPAGHVSSNYAAGGGSGAYIPTGTVVQAIPVEMNVIGPNGVHAVGFDGTAVGAGPSSASLAADTLPPFLSGGNGTIMMSPEQYAQYQRHQHMLAMQREMGSGSVRLMDTYGSGPNNGASSGVAGFSQGAPSYVTNTQGDGYQDLAAHAAPQSYQHHIGADGAVSHGDASSNPQQQQNVEFYDASVIPSDRLGRGQQQQQQQQHASPAAVVAGPSDEENAHDYNPYGDYGAAAAHHYQQGGGQQQPVLAGDNFSPRESPSAVVVTPAHPGPIVPHMGHNESPAVQHAAVMIIPDGASPIVTASAAEVDDGAGGYGGFVGGSGAISSGAPLVEEVALPPASASSPADPFAHHFDPIGGTETGTAVPTADVSGATSLQPSAMNHHHNYSLSQPQHGEATYSPTNNDGGTQGNPDGNTKETP